METLRLAARVMGLPQRRASEMLEQVDIARAAHRRVGTYSLGTRQRLGIASALLGYPEMLILDEPANGMDPAGIRWMRDLLRDFARQGGTVLLSSHLLSEIQATADRLVVVGHGRVVAQGALNELLHPHGTFVRGADPEGLARAMRTSGLSTESTDGGALLIDATPEQVGRVAASAGEILTELREHGAGLEELFLQLTDQPTDN
ncbi:MAG: ATP-binding cassette domain-containing protein [Cumulibacter sp.]